MRTETIKQIDKMESEAMRKIKRSKNLEDLYFDLLLPGKCTKKNNCYHALNRSLNRIVNYTKMKIRNFKNVRL